MNEYDLDKLTVDQIVDLIDKGMISPSYPKEYYNNEWWDENPFFAEKEEEYE